MTNLNCPYVMCKFNQTKIARSLGICRKEKVTLKLVDDGKGTMECTDAEWDHNKIAIDIGEDYKNDNN